MTNKPIAPEDLEAIPAFLRLSETERRAAREAMPVARTPAERKGKRASTKPATARLPKSIDAAGLALLREIERETEAKTKARLAELKAKRKGKRA